jgi:hypothetical protein
MLMMALSTTEIWRLRTRIEVSSFEVNKANLISSLIRSNIIL